MKTALLLSVALVASVSAHAQVFRPQVRHDRGGHQPAVVVRHAPAHGGYWNGHRGHGHRYPYGVGLGYHSAYRTPYLGYYPGYDDGYYPYSNYGYSNYGEVNYGYRSPASAAANGLWLGALAGGIIGNNSGAFRHDGWRGAAWGAGLGWILGSAVDANRRVVAAQAAAAPSYSVAPTVSPSPAAPAQAPVTIINNYYNTPASPMAGANSLFGR